jgi:ATP-dependent Clp protease ATP-binding subunit ClpC
MFEWLTRREARRRGGEGGGPGPAGPFTRFTPPAREVVTLAQREARELGHDYIGTEHLLLALLAEGGGLAARALASLEVTAGAVTADIERIVGRGQGMPPGPVPFTPRSKKVLELALREALRRRQAAVRPEHVLLALVREGNGMAAKILFERMGDLDRVGQALAALETDELERLRAEVARLRALLERHGIDPGADDADDGGAARA